MDEQGVRRPTALAEQVETAITADPEVEEQIRRGTARALWDRLQQAEARANGLRDQLEAATARIAGLMRERDGWLGERAAYQTSLEHDRAMLSHYRGRLRLRRLEWLALGVVAGAAGLLLAQWGWGLARYWWG